MVKIKLVTHCSQNPTNSLQLWHRGAKKFLSVLWQFGQTLIYDCSLSCKFTGSICYTAKRYSCKSQNERKSEIKYCSVD